MKPRPVRSLFRVPAAVLLAASTLVIAACGGGDDPLPVSGAGAVASTEKATAWAAGPISGFGSVIVNGVRFDDSSAVVSDDSDTTRGRDRLRLGMMVEVDGAAVAAGSGRALRIRFGSEIVGPVTAKDAAAGTLVVLGQTVAVTDTTVFDDSLAGGLAGIQVGRVLEVHALYDAGTGRYRATRIEDEDSATAYTLRGQVSALDTAARTFVIGGQKIAYGSVPAAALPAQLADGLRVRVTLQTAQVGGAWVATSVRSGVRAIDDRSAGHVRGAITALTGTAGFEIDGLKVDTSRALFPDGRDGLVVGARVEVEGPIVGGVLRATKVELDDRRASERHGFELHGTVVALDTGARRFVLRGVTVDWSGPVTWRDGSAARLADGVRVEVKGVPSADRTRLVATRISFED